MSISSSDEDTLVIVEKVAMDEANLEGTVSPPSLSISAPPSIYSSEPTKLLEPGRSTEPTEILTSNELLKQSTSEQILVLMREPTHSQSRLNQDFFSEINKSSAGAKRSATNRLALIKVQAQ